MNIASQVVQLLRGPVTVRTASHRIRYIASGTTGGVPWFNSSVDCPVRAHSMHGTVLVTLGTASGVASRFRGVSATVLRSPLYSYLFDCGEGTDAQLRECSLVGPTSVDRIFVTHLHGDHIFGLPGLLLTALTARTAATEGSRGIAEAQSSRRLTVFGPVGLEAFIASALVGLQPTAARSLPLDIVELLPPGTPPRPTVHRARVGTVRFIAPSSEGVYDLVRDTSHAPHDEHTVTAAVLQHSVPCVGYVYERVAKVRLQPEVLVARGFKSFGPELGRAAASLRAGRTVASPDGGPAITPREALTASAPSLKVVVMGDNCSASAIESIAHGADVVVHEATLAPGDEIKAAARRHSTPSMAGAFAARIGARTLVLTHFGKSLASAWSDACIHALGIDAAAAAVSCGALRSAEHAEASVVGQRMSNALSLCGVLENAPKRMNHADGDGVVTSVVGAPAVSHSDVAALLPPARLPTRLQIASQTNSHPALLSQYSYPRVEDSPASSALAAAAISAAGGRVAVICARDWMAFPLDGK